MRPLLKQLRGPCQLRREAWPPVTEPGPQSGRTAAGPSLTLGVLNEPPNVSQTRGSVRGGLSLLTFCSIEATIRTRCPLRAREDGTGAAGRICSSRTEIVYVAVFVRHGVRLAAIAGV